jgi:hypothetical protein
MKKVLVFIFILLSLGIFGQRAVEISEQTPIVIFPVQSVVRWRDDIAYSLINQLEYQALEAKRFNVITRSSLEQILEERKLGMVGITQSDAFNTGRLAGARYALLLELTRFSTSYDNSSKKYVTTGELFIKLFDLYDGTLINSSPVSFKGSHERFNDSEFDAVKAINENILRVLREFFPQIAEVAQVQGNYVMITGIESKIVSKGYLFEVLDPFKEGYVYIDNITPNYVIGKIRYGNVSEGDILREYPVSDFWTGVGITTGFADKLVLGVNLTGMTSFYTSKIQAILDIDVVLGSPIVTKASVGGAYNILMNRISLYPYAGLNIIYLGDEDDYIEDFSLDFGLVAGLKTFFELNPKFAVGGGVSYNINFGDILPSGLIINLNGFFRF